MKTILLGLALSVLMGGAVAARGLTGGNHSVQGLSAAFIDTADVNADSEADPGNHGSTSEADPGNHGSTVSNCEQTEEHAAAHTGTVSNTNLNVVSRTNVAAARNVGRSGSSQVASATQTNRVWQRGGETLEESHTTITCVEAGR